MVHFLPICPVNLCERFIHSSGIGPFVWISVKARLDDVVEMGIGFNFSWIGRLPAFDHVEDYGHVVALFAVRSPFVERLGQTVNPLRGVFKLRGPTSKTVIPNA